MTALTLNELVSEAVCTEGWIDTLLALRGLAMVEVEREREVAAGSALQAAYPASIALRGIEGALELFHRAGFAVKR